MFTGIVQATGRVASVDAAAGDQRLIIAPERFPLGDVGVGDSLAVSGVCLTLVAADAAHFTVDVSRETLARTTLGDARPGTRVNLETALTAAARMGGHIVSGHVDGVGCILEKGEDARSLRLRIRSPDNLARYIAEKGSICVDGVSLTVNAVAGAVFDVNIIPHTLAVTTLHEVEIGRRVNLEVDLLARYLERLLLYGHTEKEGTLSEALLKRAGFVAAEPLR